MSRTTTAEELLQAIKDGKASMGYRPVADPKERKHEDWVAIGDEEIDGGRAVLMELVKQGHKIMRRCEFHLNHGRGRGSASYSLSIGEGS